MAEKTENATPHKLKESRKKGQVGQTPDIPKLLICIGVMETIFALVGGGMQRLEAMVMLPLGRLHDPFGHAMQEVAMDGLMVLLYFCGIVCALIFLLRILGGWIQFGPLFATEALEPKFDAINPVGHLKNMFSAKQLTTLLTSVLKAIAIGVIFYLAIKPDLGPLAQLAYGDDLNGFWLSVLALFKKIVRETLALLLVMSVLDFGLQKYFFLKQQRMSHEDIRNEFKQSEGDPHMKGHRKSMSQQILNEAPKPRREVAVEEADMVLINPTHFAVGLYYRAGETPLPRLLFKAEGYEAQDIIEEAKTRNMPVIRFVWLTRTLFRTVEEGDYIPRETLKAVAQVYRLLKEIEDQQIDEVLDIEE
ncbi:type III secretion system export apparatus subunit SctU [Pantoea sp. BAV 3049]|uniref:type III secretion system export apparatus subunit SctU n=1 Tax=Pantoea sp. BAV 3049 TaxID=2654188 RepID=UPI00131E4D48|nr:type III secretion system export apparatus subunit SctU [Pantoea sp. BAV 3049]